MTSLRSSLRLRFRLKNGDIAPHWESVSSLNFSVMSSKFRHSKDRPDSHFKIPEHALSLKDDADQFLFILELFPQLYIPSTDSNSMKAVDHLYVWFSQPFYPHLYSVFSKIIDPRDSEEAYHYWPTNIIEPSRTFLGTTFSMVEHTDYANPKASVFFNSKDGIVAFTDYNQKLWRLRP